MSLVALGVTAVALGACGSGAVRRDPASAGRLVTTGVGWGPSGLDGRIPSPDSCRYGTARDGSELPDPGCTPGAVDAGVHRSNLAVTICRAGFASAMRPPASMTTPAKAASMAAYGAHQPASRYEYDHLVPLELGGSSDVRNLWPELDVGSPSQFDAADAFGENAKDGVEDRLHAAVCAGRVDLAAAQRAIAVNWTTAERVVGVGR